MKFRYRFAAILSLLALLATSAVALAAKPAPEITPINGQALESVLAGPARYTHSVCELGVLPPAAYYINYLLPPDDAYYTLIDPSACGCPGGSVLLTNINMGLYFPVTCNQPVQISVVGATGDVACYRPNPNDVICPPTNYNLNSAAGFWIFTMPLLSDCCVDRPAFICVTFTGNGAGCSTSATRPELLTTDNCIGCTSYNFWPGGQDDLCLDIGFPGNPVMYSEADCCNVTSTQRGTWGGIKVLYR